MNDIASTKSLTPFVSSQLPEFVRVDHPSFVAFLQAYYEWVDIEKESLRNPFALEESLDIDRSLEKFLLQFKKQYIEGFPESLAVSENGLPVDARKLMKNIRAFYKAKGTEKTYQFLFRVLYDTNVEFYYPKLDILRCSDGKWIQNKSIKVTNTLGRKIFDCIGRKIYQKTASGTITASAEVLDVTKYQISSFEVAEILLKNINGTFVSEKGIQFSDGSGTVNQEQKIYTVVTSVSISNGGSKYRVGDKLVFTPASGDTGQNADAKVTQVDSSGAIQKIEFVNFGINYKQIPSVSVSSNKGTGFVGVASIGALAVASGYYSGNDGKLSSTKVLQDNHYFQNYSYVLKTEVTIDKYKDVIKRLIHPAGLGFFGQVLIKRCVDADIDKASFLAKYKIPYIGNYVPYTAQTFDDLSAWFMYGGTAAGYNPTLHDPVIQAFGAGLALAGNPVSNLITFDPLTGPYNATPGFEYGDPFYIIYQHPNRIITGNVIAKIEYDQKLDFLGTGSNAGWKEWQMTGATERSEWDTSFTGGSKYVILKYDNTSEFRKITIRSFLEMPVGDKFDCRFDDGIA